MDVTNRNLTEGDAGDGAIRGHSRASLQLVVVVARTGHVASATGAGGSVDRLWPALESRLALLGCTLRVKEWADGGAAMAAGTPTIEAFGPLPRAAGQRPQRFMVEVRRRDAGGEGRAGHGLTPAVERRALVLQAGDDAGDVADAIAGTLEGVGYPVTRVRTIDEGAQALADRLASLLAKAEMRAGAVGGKEEGTYWLGNPWPRSVLVLMVSVLIAHSLNPLLRWLAGTRFEVPGFSYAFVTADTLPLVVPLVVGIPTLVALLAIYWVRRATATDPPRWAAFAMLVPVLTVVAFSVRFFAEGAVVATYAQVLHSEGIGMLFETAGMGKPAEADLFRYLRPAYQDYSHTIVPFWEPWAIFLVGLAVGVLGGRLAWNAVRRAPVESPSLRGAAQGFTATAASTRRRNRGRADDRGRLQP